MACEEATLTDAEAMRVAIGVAISETHYFQVCAAFAFICSTISALRSGGYW